MIAPMTALDFEVPEALAAREPPEARGLQRGDVRLMVSHGTDDTVSHLEFHDLADQLDRGDLLVVNTSATFNAAFDATLQSDDGAAESVVMHLSTWLSADRWVVELRRPDGTGTVPYREAAAGQRIRLAGEGEAVLLAPFASEDFVDRGGTRLWEALLRTPADLRDYSNLHGRPIRYAYVPRVWPLSFYQTVFATHPGSAEMPSAGRPFTFAMTRDLMNRGIGIVPVVLHAGVSSLEADEPPPPERYRVPAETAAAIQRVRRSGGRVIAVGTTVLRALETTASEDGTVCDGSGWTNLVLAPDRTARSVDALLTGFHAPRAWHLRVLESVAGYRHLESAYDAAVRERYRWHEFGDVHLIVRK